MILRLKCRRLLTLITLTINTSLVSAQFFFRPPVFDCSRIHPRYCCTTRVRLSCPQLCGFRPCQRPPVFVQPFSPHIPPTLPFAGLAPTHSSPAPQQPEQPAQARLPDLVDPLTAQVSSTRHSPPPIPDPPPGIILPPTDVGPAAGTPFPFASAKPEDGLVEGEFRASKGVHPVDGFAPARGGSSHLTSVGAGGSFAPESTDSSNFGPFPAAAFASTTFSPPPVANTFPTLISFVPSASPPAVAPPWPSSTERPVATTLPTSTRPLPTAQKPQTSPSPIVDSQSHRNGSQRGRAVIPPPNRFGASTAEELIELAAIDQRAIHVESSGATATVPHQASVGVDGIADGIASSILIGKNTFPPTSFFASSPPPSAPSSRELNSESPPARTTIADKGAWSFRIVPSKSQPSGRDLPAIGGDDRAFAALPKLLVNASDLSRSANWIVGGNQTTSTPRPTIPAGNGLFSGDKFNTIVDSIFAQRSIVQTISNLTGGATGKRPPKHRPSSVAPNQSRSNQTFTVGQSTTTPVSNVTNSGECGRAPDFRPCVELARASVRLLTCCRAKLLPEGCWSLCRYDTTQKEVKKAFDAGKCGILNVAPFLECASQAQDNRQCCQQRGISAKSGPQCEVFCHPRDGLGSLGLQHLVCQNVLSDLLQCHHAGLRDF